MKRITFLVGTLAIFTLFTQQANSSQKSADEIIEIGNIIVQKHLGQLQPELLANLKNTTLNTIYNLDLKSLSNLPMKDLGHMSIITIIGQTDICKELESSHGKKREVTIEKLGKLSAFIEMVNKKAEKIKTEKEKN